MTHFKQLPPTLIALQKAIEIAGGQAELSVKIGLVRTSSNVGVMVSRDKKASAKYVAKISEATGVPCHELRPDIFPAPEPANDSSNQQSIA
ncbi:transcriptional regulator [Psychrobacter sp. AOP30-A2-5]|uniref:transcriptional regulator n=1 Tax=Psychrobacter sp. AOP30-A2-5 TaxID=3457697 RepID=UPI0040352788